jgi:hypothetical protein
MYPWRGVHEKAAGRGRRPYQGFDVWRKIWLRTSPLARSCLEPSLPKELEQGAPRALVIIKRSGSGIRASSGALSCGSHDEHQRESPTMIEPQPLLSWPALLPSVTGSEPGATAVSAGIQGA